MWGRNKRILQHFENLFLPHTDGGNPAPVDRQFIPSITGFLHPRFCRISSINSITHMFIPSCAGNPGKSLTVWTSRRIQSRKLLMHRLEHRVEILIPLRRDGAKIIHQGEHLIYICMYTRCECVCAYKYIYIYICNIYICV